MSTLRKTFALAMITGLVSAGALAAEGQNAEASAGIEAAEKKALTSANEDALQKMLDAPAGVFAPEYDENGILLRLKIKGVSELTSALRGPRAERLARERAERLAKADFVKFLKEEVSVRSNDREEIIIVEKDGVEQAGYKNVSETVIETRAQGLLRGLIVLVDRFDGEGGDRTATVIFGWSKKLADAARTAQSEMARSTNPQPGQAAAARVGDSVSTGTKTRTAENLTDF